MKTDNFLKQIQDLDYIEGKNITSLGDKIGASPQEIHNLVNKIVEANKHTTKPKNKYSNFHFINGNFAGIYWKRGKKIKNFF
jgi:hypothetical protein